MLRLRNGVILEGMIDDFTDQALSFADAPSQFDAPSGPNWLGQLRHVPLDEIEAYLDHARVWHPMPSS